MKVQELFREYCNCIWVIEFLKFLEGQKVDVVGGINCLRCTKYYSWSVFSYCGVYDIDNHSLLCATGIPLRNVDESSISSTSKLAVCNMPTTFVMTSTLSGGISNHSLNAAISCLLISFPGCSYK